MSESHGDSLLAEAAFLEKQSHYRGRAKIFIEHLQFEDENVTGGRIVDVTDIERLVEVYKNEPGCLRLDHDQFIPALVDDETLNRWLERSNISNADLLDFRRIPPLLRIDQPLLALDGKHRVEAARRFLDPFDRWWIVDLYSSALSDPNVLDLRTEYANGRGFRDGDIFRHLRHYQRNGDAAQAGRWLSRLSRSKQKDLKTLLGKHKNLLEALDSLLTFTGLWGSLQLGTFHRLLTLSCEEVI
jgi:hypothetical protein